MRLKIALLGAECTGKTQLATDLAKHLASRGMQVAQVTELLREWCDEQGRSPQPHEQANIAQTQARRIDAAVADYVIADTTPLTTAIYSHLLFADKSLYPFALAHQTSYHLTLLTALDLPWVADGMQRDGPHVREPVDTLLRQALESGGIHFQVIYGHGIDRLQNAINAINSIAEKSIPDCLKSPKPSTNRLRNWACEKCSDPDCEHQLFRQRVPPPVA